MSEPLVLTVGQVAEKLQIKPAAVLRLRTKRKLAFVKIGSEVRFRIEDIEDYLKRSLTPCQELEKRPGSAKSQIKKLGTSIGSKARDGSGDAARVRMIAQKLKKSSRSSS